MKLPHAVALHALQVLGLLALLLERTALAVSRRILLVLLAVCGYTLALGVAALQTFGGRAPLDLTPLGVTGAAGAIAMLVVAYAAAFRAAPAAFRWSAPPN